MLLMDRAKSFWAALACALVAGCGAPMAETAAPAATAAPTRPAATVSRVEPQPSATLAPATPTLVRTVATAAPGPNVTVAAAATRSVACDELVVRSVILANDLECPGDALTIGASDVVLDLGGHMLRGPGPGSPTWPRPNLTSIGVKVNGQARVVVRNGTINRFSSAVYLNSTTDSRVESLEARGNYYAVYLKAATTNEISGSTFRENIYGLTLYAADRNRIVDNDSSEQTHFSPGGYGVYIYDSKENVIAGNTFRKNDNWGIWLSSSKSNAFYHNNIDGNHPQVSDDSGGNIWHEAQTREGNFWADWEGQEIAGTGIGNHPYLIQGPGGATDPYPFVRADGWNQPRGRAPQSTATPAPTRSAGGGGLLMSLPDLNQIAAAGPRGSGLRTLATLGRMASNLALSTDNRWLYVVDAATADGPAVRQVDSATGAVGTTYRLEGLGLRHEATVYLAADRDAEHLHILDGARVVTLALATGQVARDVPYLSDTVAVFPSWKHQLLLVADRGGKSVDVVWVGGGKLTYRIPIMGVPSALAANRAGTRLYAAVPGAARVPVIETEQYAVVDEIGDGLAAQRDVATSADGGRLYVLLDGDELAAYDLLTGARQYTVPTPAGARRVVSDHAQTVLTGQSPDGSGWLAFMDATSGLLLSESALPAAVRDLILVASN